MRNSSGGNALFLILIAVALFAALAYAVTQSGKGGSGGASREKESLALAQMVQYAGAVRQGLQRLMLTNPACILGDDNVGGGGYTGTVSFHSAGFGDPSVYVTPLAPVDNSCHIFNPAGAGVTYQNPPAGAASTEYLYSGVYAVEGLGTDGAGTATRELVMLAYVTRSMCLALNTQLGIVNPSGSPPALSYNTAHIPAPLGWLAIGSGFWNSSVIGSGGNADELARQPMGCFTTPEALYYFYAVLAER